MKKKPLEYALYLIELRDRTEGEIREKMRLKKYEPAEIEKTMEFLKDKDFINDERFVKRYIENKQSFGTTGKYKIRQKLMLLRLDNKLIDENLAGTDSVEEKERATELARNWLGKQSSRRASGNNYSSSESEKSEIKGFSLRSNDNYHKLGRHLVNRGFEWEMIKEVLREVLG